MRGMVDIHCHIMPDIDDGAKTKQEVVEMLRKEYESGVRAIVLTPHHRKSVCEPPKDLIMKRYAYVKRLVEKLELDMKIYCGCEYHAHSDMLDELRQNKHFRINGSRYVLLELSSRHSYQRIRNWVYDLTNEGLCPIVAHIERYPQVAENVERVSELIELGALVQINSDSLLGRNGRRVQKVVKNLIKKGYVHFIASDAHDMHKRYPNLDLSRKYVAKKWGKAKAEEILVENPQMILNKMEE